MEAAYTMDAIDATFYKAYQGETIANSVEVRKACMAAKRLAAGITKQQRAVGWTHVRNTSLGVLRMTMPIRRIENTHCHTRSRTRSTNASTMPSWCWSSQDERYQTSIPGASPVSEGEC